MAGDWIKLQKDTPDKPEVLAIASRLNIDPDAVVGKLVRVWSWFDTHTTNGNAQSVTYSFIDRICGVTGFAEQVALVGWLEQDGHELRLPNFEYHNGETAKKRALGKNRTEKHRTNAIGDGGCDGLRNAPSVTNASPEKRREEKNTSSLRSEVEPASPQRGSRLPTDWVLPDEWVEWARQERKDLEPYATGRRFADYWHGVPGAKGRKVDWFATWRNWVRGEKAQPTRHGQPAQAETAYQRQQRETMEGLAPGVARRSTLQPLTIIEGGQHVAAIESR